MGLIFPKKKSLRLKGMTNLINMEEEIINSLIQLGAAVVITYMIYLIIKEVLSFKNGGKNNNKDNLSYKQTTDERLDALEKVTGNDFKHHFEVIKEELSNTNERVDKIENRLRKVELNLAVIRSKIQ